MQLVVMGGFLKHVLVPPDFENRVTNIHPGLIPAFCGQGFYGLHVHQSVLEYGVKVSGCTIHFVDNQYDHGPIILQRVVPVLDDDTPHSLAARVFEAECEAYPQVLQWIAEGRVHVAGRRVRSIDVALARPLSHVTRPHVTLAAHSSCAPAYRTSMFPVPPRLIACGRILSGD